MKPKDLRFPFPWEERRPVVVDRVFFIPKFYDRHGEFPLDWNSKEIFESPAPLFIEYCSGNGAWIIEKAKRHPDINWIAVEQRFDRVQKIWANGKKQQVNNLFIVCGEALTFTTHFVPAQHFDGIYINFPDPWPKGKHAKNRLLQEDFISQLARVSNKNGKAVIVTDHGIYADSICQTFLQHPAWSPAFPPPYFITEWEGYGTSFFESLWRQKGLTIQYLQFSRKEKER
jgi:tRNA (guanine-N7-)-methyltransferase